MINTPFLDEDYNDISDPDMEEGMTELSFRGHHLETTETLVDLYFEEVRTAVIKYCETYGLFPWEVVVRPELHGDDLRIVLNEK